MPKWFIISPLLTFPCREQQLGAPIRAHRFPAAREVAEPTQNTPVPPTTVLSQATACDTLHLGHTTRVINLNSVWRALGSVVRACHTPMAVRQVVGRGGGACTRGLEDGPPCGHVCLAAGAPVLTLSGSGRPRSAPHCHFLSAGTFHGPGCDQQRYTPPPPPP